MVENCCVGVGGDNCGSPKPVDEELELEVNEETDACGWGESGADDGVDC